VEDTDLSEAARAGIRAVCIYLFLGFLFLLNLADIPLIGSGMVPPAFLLIGLYYWTITKPALLPVPVVFLIGLAFDIVSASVVGLHTFAFMIIVTVLRSQRRYLLGQAWPVLWVGFVAAILTLSLLQALTYAITSGAAPSLWLVLASIAIGALTYPLLTPLMAALNRFLTVTKHDYT
jgi:rod shape-determining protein MreD